MTDALITPAPRDRYAGLVVFGIVQVLLGAVCVALTLAVAAASDRTAPQPDMPGRTGIAQALVMYALAAVYFVSVGIGSMRARRWARALTVVVSAMWFLGGLVSGLMFGVMMPRLSASMPAGQRMEVFGCAMGGFAIGGILLPLGLFVFYRSDAVRETCERRDPVPRWTDRVPLPVLAVVIVLAFTAVALLVSLSNPVLPLLGSVITGAPAVLTLLALSFLSAFLAVGAYRLKESAWWTLVLLQVIGCVIGVMTFMKMDTMPMAVPVPGGADMAGLHREPLFIALMIATWVGYFAFLVYLKRFFGRIAPRTRREDLGPSTP